MSRVPDITKREEVAPPYRYIYDEIAESRGGSLTGPFWALLNSPLVAGRIADVGAYVRFESSLPERVHAVAALTAAREIDCHYEWTVNEGGAIRAGVTEEAVESIKHRRAPEGLSGDDLLVFTFTSELVKQHRVSDAAWAAMMERFGLKAVTDLCAAIGYYACIGIVMNAFEVMPGEDHPSTLPV